MCRGCEELVLQVLERLKNRVQDITSVLLKHVEPLEDVSMQLMEVNHSSFELLLPFWGMTQLLCHPHLNELLSPLVQHASYGLIVHDVLLNWEHNVEVHVSLDLADMAVWGIYVTYLIHCLFQLASLGGKKNIISVSHSSAHTLRMRSHCLRKVVHACHKGIHPLLHGLHGHIKRTKAPDPPFEDFVQYFASKAPLLQIAPYQVHMTSFDGHAPFRALSAPLHAQASPPLRLSV
mmetsp:Transcript_41216/g.74518  ORF Transcript_41216/g.74518 Transcript_41216/m.74518 type:complete len:234 (+) Transcript_41216:1235-1936(+)